MTFGVQVFNASSQLIWDSRTAGSGVVATVIALASGASGTYTFPDFAGRTAGVVSIAYFGTVVPTVDYALGYPRVTIPADSQPRQILVAMF